MKKILSFEKNLQFDKTIHEINSISLDNKIISKNIDNISGIFLISGEYKLNEISINKEPFNFEIPYDIAISNYIEESITVDIDNFNYSLINNEILKVNIDIYIEGDEKKEDIPMDTSLLNLEKLMPEIHNIPENNINQDTTTRNIKTEDEHNDKIDIPAKDEEETSEEYLTFYIYYVKENDTVEAIINKYNISKEILAIYNDIENIKKGDKLIIPDNNE